MPDLNLADLKPVAANKIKPFFEEILGAHNDIIHSIHVTGTAITDDFDEKVSDVNSVFVLKEMDLNFLELIAPLGKKYGKKKVSAPLIMTPDYIKTSIDVFPVEFLNFKLIHSTVYGDDILNGLEIDRADLRHQCERELKTKLIWLRQGYMSSMGDKRVLSEGFTQAITGYIPLFRGIIALFDNDPPIVQREVISALSDVVQIDTSIFLKVLQQKHGSRKLDIQELNTIFEDYYAATEQLGTLIDEIQE